MRHHLRIHTIGSKCCVFLVLAGVEFASTGTAKAAGPGQAVQLTPHRAVYDVELDSARSSAGILGLRGRMVFEFTGSQCEGWTQIMRLVTRLRNRDDQASVTDLRSSSWESANGSRFRFNSSTYHDRQLTETTSGDAKKPFTGGNGQVVLSKPDKRSLELPNEVMFPVQHSLALIEAAERGERALQVVLYDGSEKGQMVYDTNAVISRRIPPGSQTDLESLANSELLEDLPSWQVSISYYERGGARDEGTPSYEMGFRYYANGVARQLLIDYGDFAIKGALKEIEFLDASDCQPSDN